MSKAFTIRNAASKLYLSSEELVVNNGNKVTVGKPIEPLKWDQNWYIQKGTATDIVKLYCQNGDQKVFIRIENTQAVPTIDDHLATNFIKVVQIVDPPAMFEKKNENEVEGENIFLDYEGGNFLTAGADANSQVFVSKENRDSNYQLWHLETPFLEGRPSRIVNVGAGLYLSTNSGGIAPDKDVFVSTLKNPKTWSQKWRMQRLNYIEFKFYCIAPDGDQRIYIRLINTGEPIERVTTTFELGLAASFIQRSVNEQVLMFIVLGRERALTSGKKDGSLVFTSYVQGEGNVSQYWLLDDVYGEE